MDTLNRIKQIQQHFRTSSQEQLLQNMKNAGFSVEATHIVKQQKKMSGEKYTFDVHDLELLGYVRDVVQQKIGSEVTKALAHSGFYELLAEDPLFVHHFDVQYWADFVLEMYFDGDLGRLQNIADHHLVEQALVLWGKLRDDEKLYWRFKNKQNNIIDREAKEAYFQFIKLEATYKKLIGAALENGMSIQEIANLIEASVSDVEEIARRNHLGDC